MLYKDLLTMHVSQSIKTSFFLSFLVQSVDQLGDHSFSTFISKSFEKLTLRTP